MPRDVKVKLICKWCGSDRGIGWHPDVKFDGEKALRAHEIRCRQNPDRKVSKPRSA